MALLVGIWAGALLVSGFDPVSAFLRTFDTYFVGAFVGEGNAEVLLFTFLLGGTIGLVQRSGGALGLANALKRFMGKREGGDGCGWRRSVRLPMLVVLQQSFSSSSSSNGRDPMPFCWRSVLACTGQSYRRSWLASCDPRPRSYCYTTVSQAHGLGGRSSRWRWAA